MPQAGFIKECACKKIEVDQELLKTFFTNSSVGLMLPLMEVDELFLFTIDDPMLGGQRLLHVLACCCLQVKTEALAKAVARKERASEDTGGSGSDHSSSGSDSDGGSDGASGDVSQGGCRSLA